MHISGNDRAQLVFITFISLAMTFLTFIINPYSSWTEVGICFGSLCFVALSMIMIMGMPTFQTCINLYIAQLIVLYYCIISIAIVNYLHLNKYCIN